MASFSPPLVLLIRPCLSILAQADWVTLPAFVQSCPVALKYLGLLDPLGWEHFPERDPHRPWPGPQPAPRAPFVAAYPVKLNEQKRYMSDLRKYLVEHPALVWVLGFPLVPSAGFAWGFDVVTLRAISIDYSPPPPPLPLLTEGDAWVKALLERRQKSQVAGVPAC